MTIPKLSMHSLDTVPHQRRVAESINDILEFNNDDWRRQLPAEKRAGVTPINKSYPPLVANRYGDNTNPGVTDMTRAIEAAQDVAEEIGGGQVRLLDEAYGTTGIIARSNVYIVGTNIGQPIANAWYGSELRAISGATTAIYDTVGGGTDTLNFGLQGIRLSGLGAGTALKGMHLKDSRWSVARWCLFDNFADHAVKMDSGFVLMCEQNMAINCLLNRTRSEKEGVIDINGTDCWLIDGEYTASLSALTNSNAMVGAVALRGGTHMMRGVVGEISDFGILIESTDSTSLIEQCRADLNFGHGWEISGSSILSGCWAFRNGAEADDTYDGFYVDGASNTSFFGCRAESLVADGYSHRYGFNDQQNSAANKNYYDAGCHSIGHATGSFNIQANAGAAHDTPSGPPKPFSNGDTSPSVDNYASFYTANAGATSITTFDNGFLGQMIEVLVDDANTTFVNGSGILTNTGANVAATQNRIYRFRRMFGNWYMY